MGLLGTLLWLKNDKPPVNPSEFCLSHIIVIKMAIFGLLLGVAGGFKGTGGLVGL